MRGLQSEDAQGKPRPCDITGPAFEGLETRLQRQAKLLQSGQADENRQRVKVLLVHGIGTHPPGWSTRLQRNLSDGLNLTTIPDNTKIIKLSSANYPGESLGELTVNRYANPDGGRELLAYELSWSVITTPMKEKLAYDTAEEASNRRARTNQTLKEFLNDRISDPLIYKGSSHGKILESTAAATCWMLRGDWNELPDTFDGACELNQIEDIEDVLQDEYVFITHSLGSRIVTDSLQHEAGEDAIRQRNPTWSAADEERLDRILDALRTKDLRVYMLANQLPLLELGTPDPKVSGQFDAYCRANGPHYEERMVNQTFIVAFSDPNDPLSYSIPPGFEQRKIDSRLCPEVVNVRVNVTPELDFFGFGTAAHPLKAHTEYDEDPRVIGIIVGGVGNPDQLEVVTNECTWLQTVEDDEV